MKTRAKRYQVALLLTLLALAAFTIHAQRAVTTARSQNPNLTWGQALAAAFTGGKPASATINHKRETPSASRADALVHPKESNDTAEAMTPAQAGGNFNITESVIAGGGERSTGGGYDQTSTIGQSALGESGGGAFSVSGGFWQGAACSAPAITQHPQPPSQSVCTGSSVTFEVLATGTGLTYQWRKNTVNIPGATGSSYNIPSVVASDAGNYDVVITGDCGTVTSNAAALAVNAGATITQQPAPSQTVCVTQPASFTVAASGAGLSYQWRKGGVNIPGGTNPTFSIPSTTPADAGVYDVVITAACGSLTSMTATLTVNPMTAINTPPANQTVCVGSPASFSVGGTGAGLTYQWRKGGVNIGGATSSVYSIANAAAGDAGNYDVVVTGACGAATSSAASLTVNPATTITTQPANQTACPGGPAMFSVTATGANLTYQWRKGGVNIGGATGGSYAIAAASAGDAGSYDVVVTGACGSVTSSAASLTLNAATAINTQPTDQTVCVGAPVTFSVAASGTSPTYQWRKGGVNIAGATGSSYNIPATLVGDAGNYDVVVTGACGTVTSAAASLTINASTNINTQPQNQTVCPGDSATFTVAASGAGTLTYQWRKNGVNIPGANAPTYNIPVTTVGDTGNYSVIVSGACGTLTSNDTTLIVNPLTAITTHPESQNVTIGQPAAFSVTATGISLTYQWRKGGVNISGATSSSYNIPAVAPGDASDYDVVVTGGCGTATSNLATLTVGCQAITVNPVNTTLPAGTMGTPYSQTFTQTGGIGAIVWSVQSGPGGGLPGGLTLNASTGELAGTPTASGSSSFTIRATDANNCFGERSYTLQINNAPCPTISVHPSALTAGTVNQTYTQTFTQTGGAGAINWSVSAGTLPAGLSLNAGTGVLSGTPTTLGNSTFTIRATDANNCTGQQEYMLTVNPMVNGLQFYPLSSPVRLLDTRASATAGCVINSGAFANNETRTLAARTVCSTIPANATAIIGNITVVPSGPGFLTLFPSDATQPTVANSNFKAGEVTNNFFTVGLGAADGAFKIFTRLFDAGTTSEVIIDVTGYYAPPGAANSGGLYYHPLPAPVRLLQTFPGQTGCFQNGSQQLVGQNNPNANPALDLVLDGRGAGLPSPCNGIPGDAVVLVGNATTVFPSAPLGFGYLTIYPSDAARPTVASSNYGNNDIINGPFAVKLGTDGKFKVYTFSTTHLVIDISGYYSASANDANGTGLLFNPLPKPMRLLETRADFPGFPLTGCYRPNAPVPGSPAIRTQQVWGTCADQPITIPNAARAVVGNVTAINPAGAGFGTFFPGDVGTAPTVATTNYPFPVTFGYNRHYYVGLSPTDGTFKVLTQFTSDYIVDVSGYFAP